MLRVDVKYAKPGMVLALPVRNPNAPERCLLAAGYQMTTRDIARLDDLGVRDLIVRYPGLGAIDKYINPKVLEERATLAANLKQTLARIEGRADPRLPYEKYLQRIGALVEELLSNPAARLFMDRARGDDPWLLEHASAVAYLSLLIGLRLDGYLIRQRRKLPPRHAREVGNLGVGGMLHDVGILRLEPDAVKRYEQTRDASDPGWRAHTRIGYEMVRGQVEPSAAIVALDHHQHYDGTGFPARRGPDGTPAAPAGEKIHIFARIVAVADAFAELRHPMGGSPVPAVRAIRLMLDPRRVARFDPKVVRAFLEVTPPFAPGEPVRLSDGQWGVPIDHSPADPCRPRIQLGVDPHHLHAALQGKAGGRDDHAEGAPLGEPIDLRDRPDLQVAEAEGADVLADNFPPPNFHRLDAAARQPLAPSAI